MTARRSPEKIKQSTMKDVAQLANVSLMTVSRVLNNEEKVSQETRTRVLKAIDDLNYTLNISARGLSSSKSYVLGFFFDHSLGTFLHEYLLGTMIRCNELGYHLVLEPCDFSQSNIRKFINTLVKRHALDGIIIPPPMSDNVNLLDAMESENIRYVRVGPGSQLKRSLCVTIDDYIASSQMTEYLISMGHRKIGFIKGDMTQEVSHKRLEGYLDVMKENKIKVPSSWIGDGDFKFSTGLIAAEKMLKKTNVSAIYASNDDMAAGVIAAARKLKLDLPKDLSIAGFDDTNIASLVWPQLTTIHQPILEMSKAAVDLLVNTINLDKSKNKVIKTKVQLDHFLVSRDSTMKL